MLTSGADSLAVGLGAIAHRRDRPYVTSSRDLAEAWAGMVADPRCRTRGRGVLYRIETDQLESDADLLSLPELSFQTPYATVLESVRVVPHDPARIAAVLKRVIAELEQAQRR